MAAEELFVTPSAISHQIKTLEDFLGTTLFRREKRRVMLTLTGEKYLTAVEHALDEIDIATRRLLAAPNASVVNLSVVPAFLTRWLVPRIRQFQELHPQVELRLSASTGLIDFSHSDTDMAIYFGLGDWSGVDSKYLRGVNLVVVCSPKLLEGDHPLKTPDDLRHHTLLDVTHRQDEWELLLEKAGMIPSDIERSLTFSSTSLAISAAMEGVGVALADRALIENEIEFGRLVIPFEVRIETNKAFYLVYEHGRQLTRAMQAFHDWILAEMKKASKKDSS